MRRTALALALGGVTILFGCFLSRQDPAPDRSQVEPPVAVGRIEDGSQPATGVPVGSDVAESARIESPRALQPVPDFVAKGLEWIVESQHESGGWGAGSHSNQQLRDPHQVKTDPATTAFTAMALLRNGHTTTDGQYRATVMKATQYLLEAVEGHMHDDGRITDVTGTQVQSKLGPLIDTSMTLQFLARLLPTLDEGALRERVDSALDKCLARLQISQQEDGSWGGGGWASVLQSSVGCSALEYANAVGKQVDPVLLERARTLQQDNFDETQGRASAADSAGVELYAFAGSARASAGESKAAEELIETAKREGKLDRDAEINVSNLTSVGVSQQKAESLNAAYVKTGAQIARLDDENLLQGFGNNGGEEYLSYLLTSESLVIRGGDDWANWNEKISTRLQKIQSPDGSWTGHHCITSPVFCTAAVVQCLTADRDAEILSRITANDVAASREK